MMRATDESFLTSATWSFVNSLSYHHPLESPLVNQPY